MAISYPVAFPTSTKPTEVRWSEINNVAEVRSPYSGTVQSYDYGTGFWLVNIELSNLYRAEAAPFIAFFSAMRGRYGTFSFGDTLFSSPRGVGVGMSSPKVNGANQTGFSLEVDDLPGSASGILLAGDMIQIETSLYRVVSDVDSDGAGTATIDVWPHLKNHADNAAIVTTNPKGKFRLDSNSNITQFGDQNKLFDISVVALEVV